MKSQPRKIALLGTSADPPSRGHQALLEGLLTLFPKVVTWASNNPIKNHEISLLNRERLLQALVKSIKSKNLELVQELSSPWTITTLEIASNRWPENELIFVVGSDLASQMHKWEKAKELMLKAKIGIVPRIGWPIQSEQIQTLKSLGAKIELLPLKVPATASSEIRIKPNFKHIPPSVLEIILKEKLYDLHTII